MENEVKCWESEIGKLELDLSNSTWCFTNRFGSQRVIFINSWQMTAKGPITEIMLQNSEKEKRIIFEMIERNFNKEIFLPENSDEMADKIMKLCETVLSIDTSTSEYHIGSSVYSCAEELLTEKLFDKNVKCIHVYYGNGLFFGIRKDWFNKVKRIDSIPKRCMEFPGTRLDSISD